MNNSKINAYLFTGWGADERLFSKLDLRKFNVHYVKYPTPFSSETIEQFTHRLASLMVFQKPFIFIGVSFGGIIATELNKYVSPDQNLLISTVKTKFELPPQMGTSFLGSFTSNNNPFTTNPMVQNQGIRGTLGNIGNDNWLLMADMMYKSDRNLLNWASVRISSWKNIQPPEHFIHLHGEKDLVLPARYIRGAQFIPEAGHLAVLTHPEVINKVIHQSVY